jgi:hypothetical protein
LKIGKGQEMVNKNPLFRTVCMFAMIAILLWQPIKVFASASRGGVKNLLSEKDQIFEAGGYRISFIVLTQVNPFNDPNQGKVFRDCKTTWTKEGAFAMKIANHYEHPLVFGQIGSRNYRAVDYDDKGNLIVWRTLDEYVLCTPDRNDTLEKVRAFLVDPNGQILETSNNTMLYRWPIDKPYSIYQFKYYQFPMGIGFSRHLGTVTSAESLSSGLVKVTSKGSHAPSVPGAWELTIDPNSDYLVREAFFTMEGQLEPTNVITSSGIIEKDGIKLAKYGTCKSGNLFEISVNVTDISKVVGPNKIYDEVLSHLKEPLPSGTSIVDLRGEKPIRTTVK